MRFVKATERLPEKFVDVIVRNTRTGRVRKEQNMGFDYAFGAGDHDFEFKETEWLDEQDEEWVPVAKRLVELRSLHIAPYNLGDMGEIDDLIHKLAKHIPPATT